MKLRYALLRYVGGYFFMIATVLTLGRFGAPPSNPHGRGSQLTTPPKPQGRGYYSRDHKCRATQADMQGQARDVTCTGLPQLMITGSPNAGRVPAKCITMLEPVSWSGTGTTTYIICTLLHVYTHIMGMCDHS